MDNTPEYILMSGKAEEIQKLNSECGKVVSWFAEDKERRFWWIGENVYTFTEKGGIVWLPRQDQLQAMVLDKIINPEWINTPTNSELALIFNSFIYDEMDRRGILRLPDSMEQLWLSFVMNTLYNKKWSGNEWETPSTG